VIDVPVISNAGPLMGLAKLNLLHLLQQLYGRVYFTQSVFDEVVQTGIRLGYQDAYTAQQFLRELNWEPAETFSLPDQLASLPLDLGEKESIALAIHLKGLLLIDEERGRRAARQLGLGVRGTLGILIEAYRQNLIADSQLRLYFQQVIARSDIWISSSFAAALLDRVLKEDQG
jgi:predicted nucleic acid-binding protein